ncbi:MULTISPECIES: GNAT family N-acetyltransferase [unclassified Streptomyces]|uniref:GNAT family N-acetyltransferase n=1 Tax=unclassified Streptomyces TaxID=2593676 RepID=UPI0004CB11D8|nr:GNAT family N-acetyltransferase [Streptomyces sp. NRRL F-5727]
MIASVVLHADPTPHAPGLVLRPWCADDVTALAGMSHDPALRRWANLPAEGEAPRWVRDQERDWAAGARFGFAVLEAPLDAAARLVGGVVLKEVAPGEPTAEVGYWTAPGARGRGVAPRALDAVTAWAFATFRAGGLERLHLLHQVDNAASCRVAAKSGYAFDRVLPAFPPAFPLDGHLHIRRTR